MYCPPESGNIEPNSANAKHAQSEISAPNTHTRRNNMGCGNGPAISFAVKKIDDPMMPLTSSSTESSSPSPRTNDGFASDGFDPADPESAGPESDKDALLSGKIGTGSIIRFRVRWKIRAPCHNAGRSPKSSRRRSADR